MILSLAGPAGGAVHCVRAGADGNGSGADWTNALTELPDELRRGDTYYVAAGNYPGYTFDDGEHGERAITIRKATGEDHGPGEGWKKEYGVGAAVWGPLTFNKSFYVLDGVTGEGRRHHGFEIYSERGNENLVTLTDAAHDIAIRHTNLHFAGREAEGGDAIYGNTPAANITVSHCYIHDVPRCPLLMRNWKNLLWEHNWVARNCSTAERHSEGVSTHGGGGHVFRYNVWQDIEGTAVIVNLDKPTRDWKIYGNVFVQTDDPEVDGLGHGIVSDNFENSPIDGLEFYNNTIVGVRGGAAGLQFWAKGSRGIKAYNNLWVRCENVAFNNVEYDYNQFYSCTMPFAYSEQPGRHDVVEIGDPFVDADRMNFNLRKPTEPGMELGEMFGKDMEGRRRGEKGQWGRGALEFVMKAGD